MKKKLIMTILILGVFAGLIASSQSLGIFANTDSKEISIELKSLTYNSDHVTAEYIIPVQINTSEGTMTECSVGSSSVITISGKYNFQEGTDFLFCRPDGNGSYLVTEFIYGDFSDIANQPKVFTISLGNINSVIDGNLVYISSLGDYSFDIPEQPDQSISTYPAGVSEASSGLKMNIERVDFSTTLTKVNACIHLPDSGDWVFDANLLYLGKEIPDDYWVIPNYRQPGVLESTNRCFVIIFTGLSDYKFSDESDLLLNIGKITRNIGECTNETGYRKIETELLKYDLAPLVPDASGSYCFGSQLNQLSPDKNASLGIFIRETLKEEVEGPLSIAIK